MIPREVQGVINRLSESSRYEGETPVLIIKDNNGIGHKLNVLKAPIGWGLMLKYVGRETHD